MEGDEASELPVAQMGPLAVETLEFDGVALKAAGVLNLSMIYARRNEAVYRDQERFDIWRRSPEREREFRPACIVACEALAAAEIEEAHIALTKHVPNLNLAGDALPRKNMRTSAAA